MTQPVQRGGPAISVIVPFLNARDTLERCLESVLGSDGVALEVIAVNDGSSDGSEKIAEALGVRTLHNAAPRGPAVARNQGAAEATAPILLFLDADVTVGPNTVARALSWFDADSPYDAVIGSYTDHTPAPGFWSRFKNLQHHFTHQNANPEAGTFWSGCGAIRADRFRALGGFSPDFSRPCIEDIDLGYRLREAGGRIRLDGAMQVTHWKRYDGVSLARSDLFDRAIPWTALMLRRRVLRNDLNTTGGGAASVLLTAGAALSLPLALGGAAWLLAAAAGVAGVAALNRRFLALCAEHEGPVFAAGALGALMLHFLVGAAGLPLGALAYLAKR